VVNRLIVKAARQADITVVEPDHPPVAGAQRIGEVIRKLD
jgi:hypothetical protein